MRKFIVVAPLALLAACGGSSSDEEAAADPVAAVRTGLAVAGTSVQSADVFGVVEAAPGSERSLATQAEGTLTRILAPTGTLVQAGQVVAVLSPSQNSTLDLLKARSDAANASAALARALRLRKDGLVSDADVETARAAAQVASATLSTTGQRNGTLVLRAPVGGIVQNLTAKPGDLIPAGTAVASIGNQKDLRAKFSVDPAQATRINPGQHIAITVGTSDTKLETTVSGVDRQPDPTTRQASVYARIPASSGVGVGVSLHASLATGPATSGVTIPYSALLDDGGKSFVFVVANGVAHEVAVLPGNSVGDRIAIVKGLKAGDRVVTEGGTAIEDGMKVREDNPSDTSKPGAKK